MVSDNHQVKQSDFKKLTMAVFLKITFLFVFRRRLHCCCKAYCNGFFSVQADNPPSTPRRRTSLLSVTSKI